MPKDVYELHWKELSKMAKNICEKGGSLMNHKTAFSQHSSLEFHGIGKRKRNPSFKILTGSLFWLCSSCPTSCGTTCLTQIFDTVLNVTIEKLILYLSIMWREGTDRSRLELTGYTDVSRSGTRCAASGTHCTASATLLQTGRSALFCKYYGKTSLCLYTDMSLMLCLAGNTHGSNDAKEIKEETKQLKVSFQAMVLSNWAGSPWTGTPLAFALPVKQLSASTALGTPPLSASSHEAHHYGDKSLQNQPTQSTLIEL